MSNTLGPKFPEAVNTLPSEPPPTGPATDEGVKVAQLQLAPVLPFAGSGISEVLTLLGGIAAGVADVALLPAFLTGVGLVGLSYLFLQLYKAGGSSATIDLAKTLSLKPELTQFINNIIAQSGLTNRLEWLSPSQSIQFSRSLLGLAENGIKTGAAPASLVPSVKTLFNQALSKDLKGSPFGNLSSAAVKWHTQTRGKNTTVGVVPTQSGENANSQPSQGNGGPPPVEVLPFVQLRTTDKQTTENKNERDRGVFPSSIDSSIFGPPPKSPSGPPILGPRQNLSNSGTTNPAGGAGFVRKTPAPAPLNPSRTPDSARPDGGGSLGGYKILPSVTLKPLRGDAFTTGLLDKNAGSGGWPGDLQLPDAFDPGRDNNNPDVPHRRVEASGNESQGADGTSPESGDPTPSPEPTPNSVLNPGRSSLPAFSQGGFSRFLNEEEAEAAIENASPIDFDPQEFERQFNNALASANFPTTPTVVPIKLGNQILGYELRANVSNVSELGLTLSAFLNTVYNRAPFVPGMRYTFFFDLGPGFDGRNLEATLRGTFARLNEAYRQRHPDAPEHPLLNLLRRFVGTHNNQLIIRFPGGQYSF